MRMVAPDRLLPIRASRTHLDAFHLSRFVVQRLGFTIFLRWRERPARACAVLWLRLFSKDEGLRISVGLNLCP